VARDRYSLVAIGASVALVMLCLLLMVARISVIMYQVSIIDFVPATLTMSPGQRGTMVVSCLATDINRLGCLAKVYSGTISVERLVTTTSTNYTVSTTVTLIFVLYQPGTYTALAEAFDPVNTWNAASLTLHLYVTGSTTAPPPTSTTSFSPTTTTTTAAQQRIPSYAVIGALAAALALLLYAAHRGGSASLERY